MNAILKWLGALPWKDIISVVFSATGIGIAVVTLRSANKRNKQEARSKKVREYISRCGDFTNAYIEFAYSLSDSPHGSVDALKFKLRAIGDEATLLEMLTKDLLGDKGALLGWFRGLSDRMNTEFEAFCKIGVSVATLVGSSQPRLIFKADPLSPLTLN